MFQELKFQLSTAILTILTLAAGVAAVINFQQQHRFRLPEDGVVWVDRNASVEALYVGRASGGSNAGVRPGDRLTLINGVSIENAANVTQVLVRIGSWSKAVYHISRRGVDFDTTVIVGEVPLDSAVTYQYLVGFAYL